MTEFFTEIGIFALQAATILICLIILLAFIISSLSREKSEGELEVKNLNQKIRSQRNKLQSLLLDKKEFKKLLKSVKKELKSSNKEQPTLFVLDFNGDIQASAVEHLREEITAVLQSATAKDKVLLRLESPGGVVHGYGLAASQLKRVKDKGIPLVVSVDKIAASGGYMMAAVADEIIAAPYAILGSIGVVASLPNVNRLLKEHNVDYLEVTAGEYKRTVTPLGEITEAGLKKFKEQLEEVHTLFKDHVKTLRPQLELEKVATGEYWYGINAAKLNLTDRLATSDDVILEHIDTHRVLNLKYKGHKTLKEKISEGLTYQTNKMLELIATKQWLSRFL